MNDTFASGFANAFGQFISGTMSAKDAFTEFAVSFVRDISMMIVKQMALNAISGMMGGGGGGGLFGAAISGVSSLFKADGGQVMKGQSYIVGEEGPETFTPNTAGQITSNKDGGGQSQQSINIINVQDKSMVDEYMQSESGDSAVLNVLAKNAEKVRRIVR